MPGTLINVECIYRQYLMDTGILNDPNQRTPLGTLETLREIVAWTETLATPISYGKMETGAGGIATYSGLRPKAPPRVKKAKAAAPGERIEDMADGVVAVDEDGNIITPAPKRRGRKPKAKAGYAEYTEAFAEATENGDAIGTAEVAETAALTDEIPEEYEAQPPVAKVEQPETNGTEEASASSLSDRQARRAARKAALAGKS